jgi:hypothetical protein
MDMFTVGEMIGGINRRVMANEKRLDRQEQRMDLWSRNIKRFIMVLILWTAVLIGMSSTKEAAEFVAAVLRRFLMSS